MGSAPVQYQDIVIDVEDEGFSYDFHSLSIAALCPTARREQCAAYPKSFVRTHNAVRIGEGSDEIEVPPGTVIDAWTSAANVDPRVFADPFTPRPDRDFKPNHLSYADKTWRACMGRHLAGMIIGTTLEEITTRLPIEWDGNPPVRVPGFVVTIAPGTLNFTVDRDKARRWAAATQE